MNRTLEANSDRDLCISQVGPEQEGPYLALEWEASAPYTSFVYPSEQTARQLQRRLFQKNAGDYAPAHGRVIIQSHRVVGMMSCLSGAELRAARRNAMMWHAEAGLIRDEFWKTRVALAHQVQLTPDNDDWYLGRLAVDDRFRGRGLGRMLLEACEAEAKMRGFRKIVLEVSPLHAAALVLYRKMGFIDRELRSTSDACGATLSYWHLEKSI